MKQYIVDGSDGKDNLLYVVKSDNVNNALRKVGNLANMSFVTVKSSSLSFGVGRYGEYRYFLCSMDLTAAEICERINNNPMGEAGRGVYEVDCEQLKLNVNLA